MTSRSCASAYRRRTRLRPCRPGAPDPRVTPRAPDQSIEPRLLLFLAALAVAVGGFAHARLFYRGYDEVDVVGPLFLLNGIASGLVVLFLIFDRVALFVLGSLAISTGSLVSILISHSSSFFGFAEAAYDGAATLAPTGAALTASTQRIASGGGQVQEGKREFEARGCDACHAIAATGANGRLGPRLDTLADDKVADIVESITEPRKDIAPGYEADLVPVDYANRMDAGEIKAIATYIKAASGSK